MLPGNRHDDRISRRGFLTLLGMAGGGAAATCVCSSALAVGWLLRRDDAEAENTVTIETVAGIDTLIFPGLVRRSTWGALPPNHEAIFENGFYSAHNPEGWRTYSDPLRDVYTTIVIHHSVVYTGDDQNTLPEVQRLHRENNGWADVGYHFLIGKNGLVYEGRDIHVRGAHVAGHNTGTLGVCLLGNFMTENPTQAQINATQRLVNWLAEHSAITHLDGHRGFNPGVTVCPGDNLARYLGAFATGAGLIVGTEGYNAESASLHTCPCCTCTA